MKNFKLEVYCVSGVYYISDERICSDTEYDEMIDDFSVLSSLQHLDFTIKGHKFFFNTKNIEAISIRGVE